MMLDNNDYRHRELRQLASRVYELCDREKVEQWSSGTIGGMVASIVGVAA